MTRKSKREIRRAVADLDTDVRSEGLTVVHRSEGGELVDQRGDPVAPDAVDGLVVVVARDTRTPANRPGGAT
jgi:hypothetical protein